MPSGDILGDPLSWYAPSDVSGTLGTLSFTFCDRRVCPSPSHRGLCTVEQGVEGAEAQQDHGLYYGLLWIKHNHRG